MPVKKKKEKTSASIDQHIWKEVIVQAEFLTEVVDSEDLNSKEIAVLKEAKILVSQLLFDRVVELTSSNFTEHQKVVLALILMPDRTYSEVAEILSINYTGISHAIKGIKSHKHGKYHGGYEKKLRKICTKDESCVEYIECVRILRENDPEEALRILIKYDDDPLVWKNFSLKE